jgi:hypothetical protein
LGAWEDCPENTAPFHISPHSKIPLFSFKISFNSNEA